MDVGIWYPTQLDRPQDVVHFFLGEFTQKLDGIFQASEVLERGEVTDKDVKHTLIHWQLQERMFQPLKHLDNPSAVICGNRL